MPITIPYPTTGEPFGPGFLFRAEASGSPDLTGDAFWQVDLTAPANELSMISMHISARSAIIEQIILAEDLDGPRVVAARPEWVTGEPAQLMVSLTDSDGNLDALTTVQVVLDRQAGQNAELWANIEARFASLAPPPSFTADDRTSLQVVQAAVTPQLGHGIADLLGDIGSLVMHPPLSVGGLSTPPFELTGDGFIPVVVPKAIFGLYFLATTIPDGFGVLNGNSAEYQQRLVQFRTVHTVGGVELVTEVRDFHTHGELWLWQIALPTRVEYSISPGVVLSVRWWQFP